MHRYLRTDPHVPPTYLNLCNPLGLRVRQQEAGGGMCWDRIVEGNRTTEVGSNTDTNMYNENKMVVKSVWSDKEHGVHRHPLWALRGAYVTIYPNRMTRDRCHKKVYLLDSGHWGHMWSEWYLLHPMMQVVLDSLKDFVDSRVPAASLPPTFDDSFIIPIELVIAGVPTEINDGINE